MPSFSKNDIVLVRYPFSDLTGAKVRPAVMVGATHPSDDYLIVPLTNRAIAPPVVWAVLILPAKRQEVSSVSVRIHVLLRPSDAEVREPGIPARDASELYGSRGSAGANAEGLDLCGPS